MAIAIGVAYALLVMLLAQGSARAATPLSIAIQGNHFVNGAGQTIQLRGVNVSSSEYACVDNYGYDDGDYTDATAAAIAAWDANVVRIPLNEDCWLNTNLPAGDPYGGAGYQQEIENFVSDLNAHGIYAILDLHWTAPGNQTALEQQPMPDMNHSPAFWTSVANTFKSDPAVIFDLFNEPYDPTDPRSGSDQDPSDAVTWGCWDTGTKPNGVGGTQSCDTQAYDAGGNPTSKYQIAGMQTLLTDIRNTGAQQPVIVGGLDYANDLGDTGDANGGGQGWMQHAPDDPLNQEAASFHNYQGKTCQTQTCWDSSIAPVAAQVPVVTGEFAEDNYLASGCTPNPGASTFDDTYMNWADAHGVSYLAWVWLVDDPPAPGDDPCERFGLLSAYDGTPLAPNGTAVHDHLLGLGTSVPGPAPTNPSPSPSPAPTQPPVRLKTFRASVLRGSEKVVFSLRSAQGCAGRLTGRTASRFAVPRAHTSRRFVSLGAVRFSLRAGRPKQVTLRLTKPSHHLLVAHRRLRVHITITLKGATTRRTVLHRTITLAVPRHR
jgi:endoglucanase